MTTRVLAAGDHFVSPALLADALRERTDVELEVVDLLLPWPVEPFGAVGDVDEASGTEEQMVEALAGVEVCLTQMAPLTERVLAASPDLRVFAVGRGGPVNADVAAATRHGVAVTYAPGRNATATAEHTVALMLAAARRVPATNADLLAGEWRSDYYAYDRVGPELSGSTVGLVGFGAIGSRVARLVRGFGAQVVVHDPYVDAAALDGCEQVGLEELMGRSGFVSIHARLTPETRGIVGAAQVASMPPGGVLVNCARGGLLDYDALCDALDDGRLFGAGVDVFPTEPLPAGSRLLRTPNLVMTPHLAGASKATAHHAAEIVADDVARFLAGQAPSYCANPEVLGR